MTMITNRTAAALAAGALALLFAGVASAQTDGKCVAGKQKCAAAQMLSQFGCLSKDAKVPDTGTPTFPVLSACIAKAQTKYDGGIDPTKGCFATLDAKAATSPCLTGPPDSTDTDNVVDNTISAVRNLLDVGRNQAVDPSTQSACLSGKFKCVTNLVKALEGCEEKNNALHDAAKYGLCITKANAKWDGGVDPTKGCFAKLETKYSLASLTPCLTFNDRDSIKAVVDQQLGSINVALSCGNGTTGSGENCDDGNRVSEGPNSCDANCRVQTCPDGVIEGTETCDDNGGGECPSTCIEQACANPDSSSPKTATIQWNASVSVGSLEVLLDYPEDKVELPGSGQFIPDVAQSALTSFPSGTNHQGNDLGNLGWGLKVVVSKATAISPRPGTLFQATFNDCSGVTNATAGDFTCTVTKAFAPDGITPVSGATCSVLTITP